MSASRKSTTEVDWREIAWLIAIFIPALALWNTPVIFPLRTLVVFFHEMSHGLAAVLTGGSIVEIQVTPGGGGLCITQGGWTIPIYSAGYLGSMVWGGALLVLASRTRFDRFVAGSVGVLLVVVTVIWVRPFLGGGFLFGGTAGLALVAVGVWLPGYVNEFLLKVIGLTSCLFAFVDVRALFTHGTGHVSDATLLAERTWLPAWAWAAIWMTLSLLVAYRLLRTACRRAPATPSAT